MYYLIFFIDFLKVKPKCVFLQYRIYFFILRLKTQMFVLTPGISDCTFCVVSFLRYTMLTEHGNPIYSSALFHLCLRRKLPRQFKYGR